MAVLLAAVLAGCVGGGEPGESTGTASAPGPAAPSNGSSPREGPSPWHLRTNLSLGYLAGLGVEAFAGDEAPVGDRGQTDGSRCPNGTFHIPDDATRLAVAVRNETVDADEPGVGAYSVEVRNPEGETRYMDWILAKADDGSQFRFEQDAPAPGNWTVELDPNGAVVRQTWAVVVDVDGRSPSPPTGLEARTTC